MTPARPFPTQKARNQMAAGFLVLTLIKPRLQQNPSRCTQKHIPEVAFSQEKATLHDFGMGTVTRILL
jgi:hypothetical protein